MGNRRSPPSLGARLRVSLMAVAGSAVLLYASFTLVHGMREVDLLTRQHLAVLTEVVAKNLEAPLLFNDQRHADQTIRSLADDQDVLAVRVTDRQGQLVAEYTRTQPRSQVDPLLWMPEEWNRIELRRAVGASDAPSLGEIQVVASRDHFWLTAADGGLFWVFITLATLTASLVAGRRLQRRLTAPLERLEQAVQGIIAQKDLSQRLPVDSEDEVGRLAASLNTMLAAIQSWEEELAHQRRNLESEVSQRTGELAAAKEAAEEAARVKGRFLATISHEIRTPLTGILGMTRLLMATPLPAAKHRLAENAHRSGQLLLDLLEGVLDYSRAEAGQVKIEAQPFCLREAVHGVVSTLAVTAQAKRLEVSCLFADYLPERIVGDRHRLRQVLFNLIGNAIKFTERGEVRLSITSPNRQLPGKPTLRFEISDTGPGIAPEDQARIFDAFTQGGTLVARPQGAGLGLAICRDLVFLMGGDLRFSSTPGRGSTFWFELPLAAPDDEAAANPGAGALLPRFSGRLLLVDDDEVNREAGRGLLELMGCEVEVARNGEEAIALACQSDFDLILMDCQLPGADGWTVTRRLREMEKSRNLPPTAIVAMTAYDQPEDMGRYAAAGMNDILPKPFDEERMVILLRAWLGDPVS